MCNFPSGNFPKVRLGPLRRRGLQWEGQSAAAKGPSAAVRIDLASCRLGNYTFRNLPLGEIPLGKLLLGKNPLRKYMNLFLKVVVEFV